MRNARIVLAALVMAPTLALGQAWPHVQRLDRRIDVDFRRERIEIDVPIRATDGRVVYDFACRGGSEAFLDTLTDNWAGPLMCTLAEGEQATVASLLSEDDSPAWYSRGQFFVEDLIGACGRYPEYGRQRSFRLRGMRITLEAQDVSADGRAFVLSITVVPDPTAVTRTADQPGVLSPRGQGRSCETVIRGRDPRMCRNAVGSFEPCKD